jgi:hypothetical protein
VGELTAVGTFVRRRHCFSLDGFVPVFPKVEGATMASSHSQYATPLA